MKKYFFLTIAVCVLFLNSYSQPKEVYEQEFIVHNFKIVPANSMRQRTVITITFDLEIKQPFDEYFDYPYNITPVFTYNDKKIYADNNIYKSFYARPSYENKNIAYERYVKLEIPYELLALPAGEHNVTISLNTWNDYHNFNEIFAKKINILIPKLYDYQEQKFSISSFNITNNYKKYDLQGININFNCKYKFYSHQIKGLHNNEELKNYYFYIELFDKEIESIRTFDPETQLSIKNVNEFNLFPAR